MGRRSPASAAPDPGREATVLTTAVIRAAAALGLKQRGLARALGISPASASRLGRGRSIDPASKEGELALLLVRVFRSLDALVGGDPDSARAWLHGDNEHLRGVPAQLLTSVTGLVGVLEYLDAMRGKL